jgi:DNA primase
MSIYLREKTTTARQDPKKPPDPGATVSAPLEWKEVKKGLSPAQFTLHNMPAWIRRKGDLFKEVPGKVVILEIALKSWTSSESAAFPASFQNILTSFQKLAATCSLGI